MTQTMESGLPPLGGPGEKVDSIIASLTAEDFNKAQGVLDELSDLSIGSPYLAERLAELGYRVGEATIRRWRRRRLDHLLRPADTLPAPSRPVHSAPIREIEFTENEATVTVVAPEGEATVGKAREYLARQGQDPDLWSISRFFGSERQLANGTTLESNRWTFIPTPGSVTGTDRVDLDDLHAYVARTAGTKPEGPTNDELSIVPIIADPQWGKVDHRGDSADTLARLEQSLARFREWVEPLRPAEIVVCDGGDIIENFESTGSEDRTNDLELTEQIRLARRVQWMWIDAAASLSPSVKYLSVPSNHASIRRGKSNMGSSRDDLGIEIASQLKDMAELNPERYGHVEFYVPTKFEESLSLRLVGGKALGLIHGHQVSKPEAIPAFLEKQAAGETPIGLSDIAIFNHFHHFRAAPWGNGKQYFITPTSDNGSSWYRNISGQEGGTGVLGLGITSDGWVPAQLRIL